MKLKQVSLPFAGCMMVVLLATTVCGAQSNPVEYMKQFSDRESMLSEKYMSYMSEVAHRGRARKMEKRRLEVLNGVKQKIKEIGALKPYKGDASLRDAYKEYWSVLYNVL